jgi:hypothetical protein
VNWDSDVATHPYDFLVSKKRVRVYHEVGQESTKSTTWQFWMHRTSVYLVNSALGGMKVSLQGMDVRHPGAGHFRVEPDPRRGLGVVSQHGVELLPPRQGWPVKFGGIPAPTGDFAIRCRVTAEACALMQKPPTLSGVPSSMHAQSPVPEPGWALDLDLVFEQIPRGMEPVGYRGRVVTIGHEGVQLTFPLPESVLHVVDRPGFLMRNTYLPTGPGCAVTDLRDVLQAGGAAFPAVSPVAVASPAYPAGPARRRAEVSK